VALGATLTGITLVGGIVLTAFGAIDGISSGFSGVALVALILGILMISTHWGWVHVAEFTAQGIEGRQSGQADAARHAWLGTIEPYTRYEVSTNAEADGSLTIATIRHRPVADRAGYFTFEREVLDPERHSDEEPTAEIAERAEHRRREAALMTERERERYQAAAEDHERALLGQQNAEQHLLERRAASEALAQQINTNLKDPPLSE
jgi:hypothetical protein